MYSCNDTPKGGLPHSDIHGSKPARGSPWLFAACHVLHRLLVPRHPPNALIMLEIMDTPESVSSTMHRNHPQQPNALTSDTQNNPRHGRSSPQHTQHTINPRSFADQSLSTPLNTRHATAGRRLFQDSSSGQTCARTTDNQQTNDGSPIIRAPRDAPEPDSP